METPAIIIIGIEGLVLLAIIVAIIYLIQRRIKIRKSENFEKRDN